MTINNDIHLIKQFPYSVLYSPWAAPAVRDADSFVSQLNYILGWKYIYYLVRVHITLNCFHLS